MSTDTTTPDDSLTEDERDLLEWVADHSDRLGDLAERMLQTDSESDGASEGVSDS